MSSLRTPRRPGPTRGPAARAPAPARVAGLDRLRFGEAFFAALRWADELGLDPEPLGRAVLDQAAISLTGMLLKVREEVEDGKLERGERVAFSVAVDIQREREG